LCMIEWEGEREREEDIEGDRKCVRESVGGRLRNTKRERRELVC